MDTLLSLRWNNYLDQITDAFGSLLHKEDLVDVTLSCEGKKIKAHKMLLSACSPYFCDIFKENPCQHPVIVFRDVKFADLNAIVEFIYCGEVNVLQDQIESFLNTAQMLLIKGLTDWGKEGDAGKNCEKTKQLNDAQTDVIKEKRTNTVLRKQVSSTSEIPGCSSPSAKRRKPYVERLDDGSDVESSAVKEEIVDVDGQTSTDAVEPEASDPLSAQVSRQSLNEDSVVELPEPSQEIVIIDDQPSIDEAVQERVEEVTDESTVDGDSTIQDSSNVKLLESKTTCVPLKKRKTISEEVSQQDEIAAKSGKKSLKCTAVSAVKIMTKIPVKGKVKIPKGLTVISTQSVSKVEDLFDFPTPYHQAEETDNDSFVISDSLRSEDASTPIQEEPMLYSQETPLYDSSQISEGEPEVAEEAPTLQGEETEPDAQSEEELKEPEFDYFGCEICKTEAKPMDLERLTFNHKCPICPCACFCAHLLKEHMKQVHGWFNVQRRFTHY